MVESTSVVLTANNPKVIGTTCSSKGPTLKIKTNGAPIVVSSATSMEVTIGSVVRSGAFSGNVVYTSRRSMAMLRDMCRRTGGRFRCEKYCFLGPNRRLSGIHGAVVVGNTLGDGVPKGSTCRVTRVTNIRMPGGAGVLVKRIRSMSVSRRFTRRGLSPMLNVCGTGAFSRTLRGTTRLMTSNKCKRASSLCMRPTRARGVTGRTTTVGAYHMLVGAPSSRNKVKSLCGFGVTPSLALKYKS